MNPIVRSLLETDLYKFTMWQALLHRHPDAQTEYAFLCRNAPAYPLADLKADVDRELDHLCSLAFSDDELAYLRSLRFIKSDFVDFLTVFRFQRKFITVDTDGPTLKIQAKGPLVHVMGFEIFVLYIVNELYFRRFDQQAALAEARTRLAGKIALLHGLGDEPACRHPFEFFDFGVRRRFSGAWQEEVVATLAQAVPRYFKGTSNVYLAMKYDLVPIGNMAHE
jgi:nicotinate phosphoribosyltransferase